MRLGLPLKIAGEVPRAGGERYFDALRRAPPRRQIEYVGEVDHGEKVELLQDARATSSRSSGGAVRARHDRVDGVRDARDRDAPGRRPRGDRSRPHRIIVDDYREMADAARARRRARPARSAARTSRSASRRERMVADYVAAYEGDRLCSADAASLAVRPRDPQARRSPLWERWRPSRSTCWSTPRSSAISARPPLAGLAVGGATLEAGFGIFNFLEYGTTAQVARLTGPAIAPAAEHGVAGAVALAWTWASPLPSLRAAQRTDRPADGGVGARRPYAVPTCGSRRSGPRSRSSRSAAGLPARRRRPADAARDRDRRERSQRRARGALRLRLRLGDRGLGVGHRDRPGRHGGRLHRRHPPRRARRRAAGAGADAALAPDRARPLRPDRVALAAFTLAGAVIARFGDASSRRTRSRSSSGSSSPSSSMRSRSPAR